MRPGSPCCVTLSTAAGSPNIRHFPIWMPMPTPSRSRRSSSKTKVGSETTRLASPKRWSSERRPCRRADDGPETLTVAGPRRDLAVRLPTSADLLAVESSSDRAVRRRNLVRRCVLPPADSDPAPELDDNEIQLVAQQLAERDPQADVR